MYSPVDILPIDLFDLKDDHTVANMSVFLFPHWLRNCTWQAIVDQIRRLDEAVSSHAFVTRSI